MFSRINPNTYQMVRMYWNIIKDIQAAKKKYQEFERHKYFEDPQ